jgi:hypothetical protein
MQGRTHSYLKWKGRIGLWKIFLYFCPGIEGLTFGEGLLLDTELGPGGVEDLLFKRGCGCRVDVLTPGEANMCFGHMYSFIKVTRKGHLLFELFSEGDTHLEGGCVTIGSITCNSDQFAVV